MQITSYPDAEKLLRSLLNQMRQTLDKNLIGLYLYGSLVAGDFDPEISDIDLLAVTFSDIDNKEFIRLHNMQETLSTQYTIWDGRIEIQYLSASALNTFKTQSSQIAVISPGEPFNIKEAGIDWLINWYSVREKGVTLYGPSPRTLIPPISKEEFIQASQDYALYWAEWVNQQRDQRGQSYAILTMCRVLYVFQWGEQASKNQAALWTKGRFPQWASLIQKALVWRMASDNELVDHEVTFPETARFIHFAVAQVVEDK